MKYAQKILEKKENITEHKDRSRFRTFISKHKPSLISILIILGTISAFLNTTWQSEKSDSQSNLLYQLSILNTDYSVSSLNDSEIILDRSMAEACQSILQASSSIVIKGGCGSNNLLLQLASEEHDSLEGAYIQASKDASGTITDYNNQALVYGEKTEWSEIVIIIFFVSAILLSFS